MAVGWWVGELVLVLVMMSRRSKRRRTRRSKTRRSVERM